MKRLSINLGIGLALIAAILAAPASSPSQTTKKATVLNSTGPQLDEPGRRMYYESLSGDESKILALRQDLIAAGARYVNTFLPGLIVCEVPLSVDAYAIAQDHGVTVTDDDQVDHRRAGAPIFSREWVKSCYKKYDEYAVSLSNDSPHDPARVPSHSQASDSRHGLRRVPEDVVLRNARKVAAKGAAAQDERLIHQNSEIMAGNVLIQLIFPESSGSDENWTDSEIASAASGVVIASVYYEREFRRSDINFITRRVERVATSTEPISYTIEQDSLWVTDVMGQLGYPGYQHEYLESVHAYNNHFREAYRVDWVFTAFVVRAVNDSDHMFRNARKISYSYLGGPFLTVPYPAGSPGAFQFSQAFKLQMSRVFWALEEALGGTAACEDASGYLNYLNSNKTIGFDPVFGTPKSCLGTPVPCVANKLNMMEQGHAGAPCRYTEGMMGGSDSNPIDGVPDAFGIPPEIDFGTAAVETLTSQAATVQFSATSMAVQNRNPQQPPPLRRNYAAPLMDANYTFNGIGPINLVPMDGEYDDLEETFLVEIPVLLPGYSDLLVSVRNAYGADAEAWKQIFYLGLDYYGFKFIHGNDGVGLAWSMRGATFDADFELRRIDNDAEDVDDLVATGIDPVGSPGPGGMTPYYYYDTTVSPGSNYSYYVVGSFQADYRGVPTTFSTVSDTFNTVAAFQRAEGILSSPSPNPFRPSTDGRMWVSVSIPDATGIVTSQSISGGPNHLSAANDPDPINVSIAVYDVFGRLVKSLYQDRVYVSVVSRPWDGTNQKGQRVPSGMYFFKAKAGTAIGTKKVLVIH